MTTHLLRSLPFASSFWLFLSLTTAPNAFCQGQIIFQDNFESGGFGSQWTPKPDLSHKGLVTVATTLGNTYIPHAGNYGAALGLTGDIIGATAINALDLHLDLSSYAGKIVELSFWFKDVSNVTYDENGIWFSNNGGQSFTSANFPLKSESYKEEWGQFPPINIAKASGLTLTSNFVIRFQQRGNKDFNTSGGDSGFLFDDVIVRVSPVQYATLPFTDNFEAAELKNNWRWVDPYREGATVIDLNQVRPDGVVAPLSGFGGIAFNPCSGTQVLAMGQRQDPALNTQYVANAIDLYLNLAGTPQAELRFCLMDLDAYYNTDNIGIYFSNNGGLSFKKVYNLVFDQWTNNVWGELPPIDIDALAAANGLSLSDKFIIRFQARFNRDFNPSGGRQGVLIDSVRVQAPNIQYASLPFFDGFESGALSNYFHWSDAFVNGNTITNPAWVRPDGLVDVFSSYAGINFQAHSGLKVLAMGMRQDPGSNSYHTVNAIDLHLNLQNQTNVSCTFWMRDFNETSNAEDAVYFSNDGGVIFKKAYTFSLGSTPDVWTPYSLDVDQLCATIGLTMTSKFVIRFQQRGNGDYNSAGSQSGIILDDISVCAPPGLIITGTNTTCNQNNGAASVNFEGNATVLWSNGQTAKTITGLAPGTYTVTVTASGNCSSTGTVSVNSSISPPSATMAPTHTTCGQANGKINLVVIGLNSPYTYLWNDGITTEDRENLPSGVYAVTVTDKNGCTTVNSTAINGSQGVSVNLGLDQVIPQGGSVMLCANNQSSFAAYMWSTGAMTPCITVSTVGIYTVTVTANNGCTAIDVVKVDLASATYDVLNDEFPLIAFPNPAYNRLSIRCQGTTISEIQITDATGRVVLQQASNIPADIVHTFDIGALPAGMYLLRARGKGYIPPVQFVKQ